MLRLHSKYFIIGVILQKTQKKLLFTCNWRWISGMNLHISKTKNKLSDIGNLGSETTYFRTFNNTNRYTDLYPVSGDY